MNNLSIIIGVLGLILTVFNIIDKIAQFKTKIDAPELRQNERIESCENKLILHDAQLEKFSEYLSNDDKRIKNIQDTNRIFARSLLALLSGSELEKSKVYADLHDYLINHLGDSNV